MWSCFHQRILTNLHAWHFSDGEGDEEDSEKVYEERMLSQDVASLKDRHWRDPKQGFVDMTVHAEHTGAMFSLSVPDIPGGTMHAD